MHSMKIVTTTSCKNYWDSYSNIFICQLIFTLIFGGGRGKYTQILTEFYVFIQDIPWKRERNNIS